MQVELAQEFMGLVAQRDSLEAQIKELQDKKADVRIALNEKAKVIVEQLGSNFIKLNGKLYQFKKDAFVEAKIYE